MKFARESSLPVIPLPNVTAGALTTEYEWNCYPTFWSVTF